jgi:hypothetical protein
MFRTFFAAIIGLIALSAAPAFANNFCQAQVAPYRSELEAKVNPVLTEIDSGIEQIRKNGGDPDTVAFKMHDGTFKTLPELRRLLVAQKGDASKEIDAAANKCSSKLKPMQDVTDAAVTIATGGLNKLLPERMSHIEIGQILAGKPFGGEGALVPHFRDQLLGVFHIDAHNKGFIPSIIVDPINTILGRR